MGSAAWPSLSRQKGEPALQTSLAVRCEHLPEHLVCEHKQPSAFSLETAYALLSRGPRIRSLGTRRKRNLQTQNIPAPVQNRWARLPESPFKGDCRWDRSWEEGGRAWLEH